VTEEPEKDDGISPDDVRRLARLIEENGLSELRYERGDVRVTLRTADAVLRRARFAAPAPSASGFAESDDAALVNYRVAADNEAAEVGPAVEADALPANAVRIEAPVMGVFYRASAPDEPPLVEVGDGVEAGQPVGLIEAMKVFSEVLAEIAGTVRAIPAKNGALVHPGDPLVILETSEL